MVRTHSDLQEKTQLDNDGYIKFRRVYNELIGSWCAIVAASHELGHANKQVGLDL